MSDRRINQYSNDNAIINGAERIYHDVNAGGECRVPWCTFSSDVEGSEHLNLDRVLQEPGQFNPFKKLRGLEEMEARLREALYNEFREYTHEDADADIKTTLHLTLMVMRLMKLKYEGAQDKLRVLGAERDNWLRGNEESSTLWQYITETWPMRITMLEREGHKDHGVSFIIALFESLRRDLMQAAESVAEKVTVQKVFPNGDHMTPGARRNVTLNDLHTMLLGLVLSGADVAVRDLHDYVQRHVLAVHALVHTSLELEGYSDECCVGCTEHKAH